MFMLKPPAFTNFCRPFPDYLQESFKLAKILDVQRETLEVTLVMQPSEVDIENIFGVGVESVRCGLSSSFSLYFLGEPWGRS